MLQISRFAGFDGQIVSADDRHSNYSEGGPKQLIEPFIIEGRKSEEVCCYSYLGEVPVMPTSFVERV